MNSIHSCSKLFLMLSAFSSVAIAPYALASKNLGSCDESDFKKTYHHQATPFPKSRVSTGKKVISPIKLKERLSDGIRLKPVPLSFTSEDLQDNPSTFPLNTPEHKASKPQFSGLNALCEESDSEIEDVKQTHPDEASKEIASNEEVLDLLNSISIYSEEDLTSFFKSLQPEIVSAFPATGIQYVLMKDNYIYELNDGVLIALFNQSSPDYDWTDDYINKTEQ